MAPDVIAHRRTHNLLLISHLLDLRENLSPFTLILDNIEQSGMPVVREFLQKARSHRTCVVYVAFETIRKPPDVDVFIKARGKPIAHLLKEIVAESQGPEKKCLIIIDSLHSLAAHHASSIPALLSAIITPTSSLLALYHLDEPIFTPDSAKYLPHPLTLLKYYATTIFTVYSFAHILAQKAAADRSLAEPVFGLAEELEGVVKGLKTYKEKGLVLEMEHRRKSGRTVSERYFFSDNTASPHSMPNVYEKGRFMLLEDQPLYQPKQEDTVEAGPETAESTFNMVLTEKQRRDRENVVLPYFDAQKGEGGSGGRILYDLGEEDDFDEEEDEI